MESGRPSGETGQRPAEATENADVLIGIKDEAHSATAWQYFWAAWIVVDDDVIVHRDGGDFLAAALLGGAGEKFVGRVTRASSCERCPQNHFALVPDRQTRIDVTLLGSIICKIAPRATAP